MKEKLKKYKAFTNSLLPHEAKYILNAHRFQDSEKIQILEQLVKNVNDLSSNLDLDYTIDKRKYSYVQKWVTKELDKINVDKKYIWISQMQQDILLDKINSDSEINILKSLSSFNNTSYYFTKHYEMLIDFRQYLLIRKRYADYKKVDAFINQYTYDYQRSQLINQQMNQATKEIMGLGNKSQEESLRWKNWLNDVFTNNHLDGLNRYLAFVRLSYYFLNVNDLNALEKAFEYAQKFFENGKYYSRRLLLNFYDNSLVLYDRKKEYDKAYYYGKLSIKGKGPDQLLYFNNFINILLKQNKYQEALSWINTMDFKISNYKDNYSIIGYVSNYIRCLSRTDHINHAINKAKVFWENNKAQIMEYRWHRFLSAFIEALLIKKEYLTIIRLINRYKLIKLERESFSGNKTASRTIEAVYYFCKFKKGEIPKTEYTEKLNELKYADSLLIEELTY